MPKKYAKHGRNKRKPNARQQKVVKELAKGKTLTQAAEEAGYSGKNAAQSGYQALAQLRGRVPDLLERHGLGEEVLIQKYLLPLLEAEETKFAISNSNAVIRREFRKLRFQMIDDMGSVRSAILHSAIRKLVCDRATDR